MSDLDEFARRYKQTLEEIGHAIQAMADARFPDAVRHLAWARDAAEYCARPVPREDDLRSC